MCTKCRDATNCCASFCLKSQPATLLSEMGNGYLIHCILQLRESVAHGAASGAYRECLLGVTVAGSEAMNIGIRHARGLAREVKVRSRI